MFEDLTRFLPEFQGGKFGEWIVDHENDGTPEHPIQLPFVAYNDLMMHFTEAVHRFTDQYKSMELNRYIAILEQSNIRRDLESMRTADVSVLDGRTVMAMIVGAIRAERFCDGALLELCKDGTLVKWLNRLQQIDDASEP